MATEEEIKAAIAGLARQGILAKTPAPGPSAIPATPGEEDVFDRPTLPFLGQERIGEKFRGLMGRDELERLESQARPAFQELRPQDPIKSRPLYSEPALDLSRIGTNVANAAFTTVQALGEVIPSLVERRTEYPGQAAVREAIGLSPIEEQQATSSEARDLLGQLVQNPLDFAGTQQIIKDLAELQESRPFLEQILFGLVDPLAIAPSVVSSLKATQASRKLGQELLFGGKGKGFPPAAARVVPEAVTPTTAVPKVAEEVPTAARGGDVTPTVAAKIDPEWPSGVKNAMVQTEAIRVIDRPSSFGSFIDRVPGLNRVVRIFRPANTMSEPIITAYNAEKNVQSALSTQAFGTRFPILNQIEEIFGNGASRGKETVVQFIGPADELILSIKGTVLDIAQRPHFYNLSAQQRQLLQQWQRRNDDLLKELIDKYNIDISPFPAPKNGVFLSNVDRAEDLLKVLDETEYQQVLKGRAKTRRFNSAADRIKSDPDFVPITDIELLQAGMDESKAIMAGTETFRRGSAGLTLIQVVDKTHPGLRVARDALTKKIESIKNRIRTAENQARQAKASAKQTATEVTQAEKRAQPLRERIDELGDDFGPELSHLSGEIREILFRANRLERRGVVLTTRVATKKAKTTSLIQELNALAPKLEEIRKKYKAKNLKGFQFVEDGVYRYFPVEDAKVVKDLRTPSTNTLVRILNNVAQTVLGGDFSPILGIQMPLGALFNPKMMVQRLVGANKAAWKNKDLLHSFRAQTMSDAIAENPLLYRDFAFFTGIPVMSGTPEEFAGGLLKYLKVPGTNLTYTKANDSMFATVLRQSVAAYEKEIRILAQHGVTGDTAKAVAADLVTQTNPIWNSRRLGMSPRKAAAFRSLLTSASFLTRPATLISTASSGFVKMGLGVAITPQERLAVKSALTLAASVMTLSITSAVANALLRGKDPWTEALAVADPTASRFASIPIPGTDRYIPLGGPYRSMIKMIVPRKVDYAPVPVPFANVGNFASNRVTPAIKTQIDLFINRDFEGSTIRKGAMPEHVLRTLLYEFEGMSPLTVGEAIGGIRRGLPPSEIIEESVAQFAGTNIGRETPRMKINLMAREWAKEQGIRREDGGEVNGVDDLSPLDGSRDRFISLPEVIKIQAAADKRAMEDGSEYKAFRFAMAGFEDETRSQMENLAQELGYGRELRLAIDDRAKTNADKQSGARALAEQAGTLDFYDDLEPKSHSDDIALGIYYEKMFDEENPWINPSTGEPDFAKRDKILAELAKDKRVGVDRLAGIAEHIHTTDSDIQKELRKDRELMRPYWEITRNKMVEWDLKAKKEGRPALLEIQYDKYLNTKEHGKVAFLEANEGLSEALKFVNAGEGGYHGWVGWKRVFRMGSSPEIERALFKWGYITTFIHEENSGLESQMRQTFTNVQPVGSTP